MSEQSNRLTEEQQKLVEDNHNLIYSYAQKMNLDLEEYYDILAIGLCYAASRYDRFLGVAFSTFAYECMKNECYKYWRAAYLVKRVIPKDKITYYDAPVKATAKSKNPIDGLNDISCKSYEFDPTIIELKEFYECITEDDRKILNYIMLGYRHEDIGKMLGITRSAITVRRKYLKRKWQTNNYHDKNYILKRRTKNAGFSGMEKSD